MTLQKQEGHQGPHLTFCPVLPLRNQCSLEKWLVPGLGQVTHVYKVNLEDFVVPESKAMLKK